MLPAIIHGDCLEALKNLKGEMFDLCLIDPPYFDYATNYRKDKKSKLSQSLHQQSQEDQLETVHECLEKMKQDRAFFFFTNWQEAWWFQRRFHTHLRNEIIWYKGNWTAGDLSGSFGASYEVIFLGCKGKGWKYKGARLPDLWAKDTDLFIPRVGNNRFHATEKPVELYKRIIEISTEEGDLVFDPYVGSGASAIAAYDLKREFLGYEVDEEYYKIATDRLAIHVHERSQ